MAIAGKRQLARLAGLIVTHAAFFVRMPELARIPEHLQRPINWLPSAQRQRRPVPMPREKAPSVHPSPLPAVQPGVVEHRGYFISLDRLNDGSWEVQISCDVHTPVRKATFTTGQEAITRSMKLIDSSEGFEEVW